MTLGRCPLSIFCSRGTPPECQGQNLAVSVLCLPNSFDWHLHILQHAFLVCPPVKSLSSTDHTVGYGAFIKCQLASTQLTFRLYVVQIWSLYPQIWGSQTLGSPPSGEPNPPTNPRDLDARHTSLVCVSPRSESEALDEWCLGRAIADRCRANSAQIRQSRPDSGRGFPGEVIKTFTASPLCSEADALVELSQADIAPALPQDAMPFLCD